MILHLPSNALVVIIVFLKQVQIKVHAAGINPVETYIRSGNYARKPKLPFTPGKDCAGVITQVGENVKKLKVRLDGSKMDSIVSFNVSSRSRLVTEFSRSSPKPELMLSSPFVQRREFTVSRTTWVFLRVLLSARHISQLTKHSS